MILDLADRDKAKKSVSRRKSPLYGKKITLVGDERAPARLILKGIAHGQGGWVGSLVRAARCGAL
jgi:hypothetical protein